jgi:hypothetical protein
VETTHQGGCHCSAVRFELLAPAEIEVSECNCSICSKSGYLHLIVARERFRLLRGEQDLASYSFGTGVARHLFCRKCGIKSFYVPRSHPEGFSVNARCLDEGTVTRTSLRHFDGRNWERAAEERGYGPAT